MKEVVRGLLVTAAASTVGPMLGAIMVGLHPLGGLSLLPFTIFGSFVVLLPIYIWFSNPPPANRRRGYAYVIMAGLVGGSALIGIVMSGVGGVVPYDRWLSEAAFHLYIIGGAFGLGTSIAWIIAHYITARMHQAWDTR